jgi:hypothetical protein
VEVPGQGAPPVTKSVNVEISFGDQSAGQATLTPANPSFSVTAVTLPSGGFTFNSGSAVVTADFQNLVLTYTLTLTSVIHDIGLEQATWVFSGTMISWTSQETVTSTSIPAAADASPPERGNLGAKAH